jgi:hypothetical protein
MAVDRYTKAVLTVIAVCLVRLVWLSAGGPSLATPVSAQTDQRILISGWVDAKGNVVRLPEVRRYFDETASIAGDRTKPYQAWELPVDSSR